MIQFAKESFDATVIEEVPDQSGMIDHADEEMIKRATKHKSDTKE